MSVNVARRLVSDMLVANVSFGCWLLLRPGRFGWESITREVASTMRLPPYPGSLVKDTAGNNKTLLTE